MNGMDVGRGDMERLGLVQGDAMDWHRGRYGLNKGKVDHLDGGLETFHSALTCIYSSFVPRFACATEQMSLFRHVCAPRCCAGCSTGHLCSFKNS